MKKFALCLLLIAGSMKLKAQEIYLGKSELSVIKSKINNTKIFALTEREVQQDGTVVLTFESDLVGMSLYFFRKNILENVYCRMNKKDIDGFKKELDKDFKRISQNTWVTKEKNKVEVVVDDKEATVIYSKGS